MNPTEPNSDSYSTDLNAIALPTTETTVLNQEPQTLGSFLDRLYGTLFIPKATFEQLKANPSLVQGVVVIALVNMLETLRLDQFSIFRIIWSVISGIIGWLFFTFLLKQLAGVFQKHHIKLVELLTLTGFASLPGYSWLLLSVCHHSFALPSRSP